MLKNLLHPVRAVQSILALDGLVWTGMGIFSWVSQVEKYPNEEALYSLLALMMFGNALVMLLCAWLIGKRKKLFYLLTLAVMMVNLILTFTDQFGGFDLATLLLDMLVCGIMIFRRENFLPGPRVGYLQDKKIT
jgi:uncharacterized membrane protein